MIPRPDSDTPQAPEEQVARFLSDNGLVVAIVPSSTTYEELEAILPKRKNRDGGSDAAKGKSE